MPGDSETLMDSLIDRELQALLDVAPSGDFVARVRTAVAAERPRSQWWPRYAAVAAAGVLAAAIILAARLPATVSGTRHDTALPRVIANSAPAHVAATSTPQAIELRRQAMALDARVTRSGSRRAAVFHEVLVSVDDVRGYRALVDRPEILTMTLISGVVSSAHDMTAIVPVDVAPIVVRPIDGVPEGGSE